MLTADVAEAVTAPFVDADDRRALARAGVGLEPTGFATIASRLSSLSMPVRAIYGVQDRILPDVADTMDRLLADVPHAEVTPLAECGHFLQEERPDEVGSMLAAFFATTR